MFKKIIILSSLFFSIILLGGCNSQSKKIIFDPVQLPNGNIKNMGEYGSGLNGNRTTINPEGEVIAGGYYQNGKKEGKRIDTSWSLLGWTSEGIFKDGKKEGQRKIVFDPENPAVSNVPKGDLENYMIGEMQNDKPVGKRTVYYHNGETEEMPLEDIMFFFGQ